MIKLNLEKRVAVDKVCITMNITILAIKYFKWKNLKTLRLLLAVNIKRYKSPVKVK